MQHTQPDDDGFTRVHVDLPNHSATGGETMWAEILGGDLYRLHNVPFHAYGLNLFDVVRATRDSGDPVLHVREVVEPSGRRTVRVVFLGNVPKTERLSLMESLVRFGASWENADWTLWAIDMKPEADFEGLLDQLDTWADAEMIGIETCQPKMPGSFDALPDEGD